VATALLRSVDLNEQPGAFQGYVIVHELPHLTGEERGKPSRRCFRRTCRIGCTRMPIETQDNGFALFYPKAPNRFYANASKRADIVA
jgi:hypothetical protein